MALLKIARLGNPVLRQQARAVDVEELKSTSGENLQPFLDDLIETMRHEGGVGIAAPQVGESIQVIVVEYQSNERYPDEGDIPLTVLVNPVITRQEGEPLSFWEGCLSLSEFRGLVTRPSEVTVEAYDHKGERLVIEASGFFAIVLQHEIDHLHGKVFLDRMTDLTQLAYNEEFETYWVDQANPPLEV